MKTNSNIKDLGPFYKYEGYLTSVPLDLFMSKNSDFSGRILDAGCGNMPYRWRFKKASEYIGIDYVRFPAFTEKDIVGNIANLPFSEEEFDVVLNNQVLEHIKDPKVILMELNRVLKKDGILILTVPQMCRIHGEPNDYYRFTKFGIEYLLISSGFKITTIETMGGFWRAIGSHLNFYLFENATNPTVKNLIRKTIVGFNNKLFSFLDKQFYSDKDTLGYMVIASKK